MHGCIGSYWFIKIKVNVCTILNERDVAYVNFLSIYNGAIIHGFTAEVRKKLEETDEEVIGYVLPELRERFASKSKEVLLEKALHLELDGIKFSVPVRGDKKTWWTYLLEIPNFTN